MDERYEEGSGYPANNTAADAENTNDGMKAPAPEELWSQIKADRAAQEPSENESVQEKRAERTETRDEAEDIPMGQMNFSPQGERMAAQKAEKRKKNGKLKKPMGSFAKSALNGLAFGLCAAIVFVAVMVIGNKTFLKKSDESAEASTEESADELVLPDKDADIHSTDSDDRDQSQKKADAEKGNEKDVLGTASKSDTATISEITKSTMPSIVSITVKGVEEVMSMFGMQQYESEGAGSGIVISDNGDEYFIATNNHVVSGAQEVSVCFDDTEEAVVAAEVRGTDEANDLAIVSVKKSDIDKDFLENIKVINIGSSDALQVGDQVIAIGNALGYGQSVTTGIVSALNRDVEIDNMSAKLIQTDAAINPGNSGGALLNMKGELVGINSAKFASETIEGMGYAIPVDTAKPILDKLMNRAGKEVVSDDEAGFLGVTVQDVSKEAAENYGIPSGAYIGGVEEGGAAAKAGLVKGDVIQTLDGVGISGAADLKTQLSYYKQGETVEVGYMRQVNGEYESQTVNVTLAASSEALKQRQQERENNKSSNDASGDNRYGSEETPQLPDRGRGNSGRDYGEYGDDGYGNSDLEEFFDRFFGEAQEYGYGVEPQSNKGI